MLKILLSHTMNPFQIHQYQSMDYYCWNNDSCSFTFYQIELC